MEKTKRNKKLNIKKKEIVLYVIAAIIVVCILPFAIISRVRAQKIGSRLGEEAGYSAGKFAGSFEAFSDYDKAYEEGKAEGLSANDITEEVANSIKKLEKLEVLAASVKLYDVHSAGREGKNDYKALYLLKGEAVFTVDLSQAEIKKEENTLYIQLPLPEAELTINQEEIEKIAEYQRKFFNGSAEEGFDAYLNSMKKIDTATEETIANYDSMMISAKESAKKQVAQLVSNVTVSQNGTNVEISFLGE